MKIRVPFQGCKRGHWHWLTKSLESRKFACLAQRGMKVWDILARVGASDGAWGGGILRTFSSRFLLRGPGLIILGLSFLWREPRWETRIKEFRLCLRRCLQRKLLPNRIRFLPGDGETPEGCQEHDQEQSKRRPVCPHQSRSSTVTAARLYLEMAKIRAMSQTFDSNVWCNGLKERMGFYQWNL